MKQFTLIALLLILCAAGANAQITDRKINRFPEIKMQKLKLNENYLGKNSSTFLESIKLNGVTSRYLPDDNKAKADLKSKKNRATKMPIIKPDSTIKFHILAVLPDSATLYHMPVKKPD
jgi:hypothetical protein